MHKENLQVVACELATSAMFSSLVSRNICANFVLMQGVFVSKYAPPSWRVQLKESRKKNLDGPGQFLYIQMEHAEEGDAETLIDRLKQKLPW